MPKQNSRWTDRQIELIIGKLLRIGVILAAFVVFAGGIYYLAYYGASSPDYRVFRGEPTDLRHVRGIVQDAFALHSRGLIQLGLLLLIATPVARVAFSILAFAVQRDRVYVVVTIIVLSVLMFSLAGGHI